jgi:hypothetical protein
MSPDFRTLGDLTPMPASLNTWRSGTFPADDLNSEICGSQALPAEHDKHVIEMNEVRRRASGWVQGALAKFVCMISEPGHLTGHSRDPLKEETTMLKTISAALLAVSVIAAPALAATVDKVTPAPVTKTTQAPVARTTTAPVIKTGQSKSKLLNANARMGRHHHQRYAHHRHHKHMAVHKTHVTPKVATKHVTPAPKRG